MMRLVTDALRDTLSEIVNTAMVLWDDWAFRMALATFAGVIVIVATIATTAEFVKAHEWGVGVGLFVAFVSVACEGLIVLFARALVRRWRREHKRKNDE